MRIIKQRLAAIIATIENLQADFKTKPQLEQIWVKKIDSLEFGFRRFEGFTPSLQKSIERHAKGTPIRGVESKAPSVASVQKNVNPECAAASKRGKAVEEKQQK